MAEGQPVDFTQATVSLLQTLQATNERLVHELQRLLQENRPQATPLTPPCQVLPPFPAFDRQMEPWTCYLARLEQHFTAYNVLGAGHKPGLEEENDLSALFKLRVRRTAGHHPGHDPKYQPYNRPNYDSYDPNYQPDGPNYQPDAPEYAPYYPNYQPDSSDYQPEYPNYETDDANYQPEDPSYQPEAPKYEPEDSNYQAYDPKYQPYDPKYQPKNPNYQPYHPRYPPYDRYYQTNVPNPQRHGILIDDDGAGRLNPL